MDDKLRTPANVPNSLNANRPLQPFPQTAYQQVQRSEPIDTPATLPHIGGPPPLGQPKKSRGKAILMILLTLLMLGAVALAGLFYTQMTDAQRQADAAHAEAQRAKSESNKLKEKFDTELTSNLRDESDVYGKLFYKMLGTYHLVIHSEADLSAAELAAEKIAIENAYKSRFSLPATDEPLKNKQIEIMAIYQEDRKTRALVYVAPTADDSSTLMPFVREGTAWEYAESVEEN